MWTTLFDDKKWKEQGSQGISRKKICLTSSFPTFFESSIYWRSPCWIFFSYFYKYFNCKNHGWMNLLTICYSLHCKKQYRNSFLPCGNFSHCKVYFLHFQSVQCKKYLIFQLQNWWKQKVSRSLYRYCFLKASRETFTSYQTDCKKITWNLLKYTCICSSNLFLQYTVCFHWVYRLYWYKLYYVYT